MLICCQCGFLQADTGCPFPSEDEADVESSSIKSLSDVQVKHGDDEHSDAQVKFVEVGDEAGEV